MIKLGDDHQVQAKKKGIVHLGGVDIETFFVSEFRISPLSVGQLYSDGYTTIFRSGICSIADAKGQKVLGTNLEDGLYILSMDGSAHIFEIKMLQTALHSNTVFICHRCVTHLNHQNLTQLLESSCKHIMDPDVGLVTDPMDDKPMITVDPVHKPDKPGWEALQFCPTCIHTEEQQNVIRTKSS